MKIIQETKELKTVSFVVDGKPQGKARARTVLRGAQVRTYTPKNTANYENYIKLCFKQANKDFFSNNPLKLSVIAYCPMPSVFGLKKREQALKGLLKPCVKPDGDNILKVVADALNNIAYSDDKNIVEMSICKKYGELPKLEIKITEVL